MTLHTVDDYQMNDTCPRCQGAGSLWVLEGEITCPRCGGSGEFAQAVADAPPPLDLGPPPEREQPWHLYDHAALVEKIVSGEFVRPQPTIGVLTMQSESPRAPKALFYPGKVNLIYGAPDCGKTFTALIAARQVLADGRVVIFIDFEDSPEGVYQMLVADLGVPAEAMTRFLYVVPTRAMQEEDGALLRDLLTQYRASLVIADSTGEGMALDRKNQNEDEAVATWMRMIPTMMANHDAKPAVVLIDHLPKAETKAGSVARFPIGSQRKQAVVRGASYHQEVVLPFSRGQSGFARLVSEKDKGGTYAHGQEVALLVVTVLAAPSEHSDGMSAWDLISVDPDAARLRGEAAVRRAILAVLVEAAGDDLTMIKGDVVAGVADRIEVPRGIRVSDVLEVMVTEGVVAAIRCGRGCTDPSHDDPTIKRNGNKTHYALGSAGEQD